MSFATPRPIMLFCVDEVGVFLEVAAKDKRRRSSVYMSMIKQDSGRSTTQKCMKLFFSGANQIEATQPSLSKGFDVLAIKLMSESSCNRTTHQ